MKALKANFEVLPIPEANDRMGVLMHLERIGRTCYKSEDKITAESCLTFIKGLRNRKHWAMLEHYIFAFSITEEIYNSLTDRKYFTMENAELIHALKFINATYWPDATSDDLKYIVSGSATAFNNIWNCDVMERYPDAGVLKICHFMRNQIPELMLSPTKEQAPMEEGIRYLSRSEIASLPPQLRMIHDFISVLFSVDRGVTHELVRHRPASWAQESTRYCNYSKGELGGEIAVIDPFFFEEGSEEREIWNDTCQVINDAYIKLTKKKEHGGKYERGAQEARSILPQSTKADIVMTATLLELRHFFKMRLPKTAHPQMREVVVPFFQEIQPTIPVIFDHLVEWIDEGRS